MINKLSGRVANAVMSFGGFFAVEVAGARFGRKHYPIEFLVAG